MKIGYARKDITPRPGITLGGCLERCNRPAVAVATPLFVNALALEADGVRTLILSFDVLALGTEMDLLLHTALDMHVGTNPGREMRVFCSTGTPGAPALLPMPGGGIPELAYWRRVVAVAVDAAEDALSRLQSATCRMIDIQAEEKTKSRKGKGEVASEDRFLFLRFDDESGKGIVGVVSGSIAFARAGTRQITADMPGILCAGLHEQCQFPWFFLQGPSVAEHNPGHDTKAQLAKLIPRLATAKWPRKGVSCLCGPIRCPVTLKYEPWPRPVDLQKIRTTLLLPAHDGSGPAADLRWLATATQLPTDWLGDRSLVRHVAQALMQWCERTREKLAKQDPRLWELGVFVLKVGPVVFVFVAAGFPSVIVQTLRKAFPKQTVCLVSHATPFAGFLRTDKGSGVGRGPDLDYRFYDQPAPFAPGVDRLLVATIKKVIRQL